MKIDSNFYKSKISQLYQIAFLFQKMIFTETGYITHNHYFVAIVKAFKT